MDINSILQPNRREYQTTDNAVVRRIQINKSNGARMLNLPKSICDKLHLEPRNWISFELNGNHITLRKAEIRTDNEDGVV
jgi:antitoxin component of MazEF toxin-antitoxin module